MAEQFSLANGAVQTLALAIGQSVVVQLVSGTGTYVVTGTFGTLESRTLTQPAVIGLGPYNQATTVAIQAGIVGYMNYQVGDETSPQPPLYSGNLSAHGKSVILLGGSETARGNCISATTQTGVTGDGIGTMRVVCNHPHNAHSGVEAWVSCPLATPASFNNGVFGFNNSIAYGKITVIDDSTFTIPYTPIAGQVGPNVSTQSFDVLWQKQLSPNGKFNEINRRLRGQMQLYANVATGSNNTANLVERIPLVVSLITAGSVNEVRGALGIGNTLLYAASHGWTPKMIVAQLNGDVGAMVQAFSAAGAPIVCDLPAVQLDTDGFATTGLRIAYETLREMAYNNANKFRVEDHFSLFVDPATGKGRPRYYRGGDGVTDNTHPSHEGVVMTSYTDWQGEEAHYQFNVDKLIRSSYDSRRADSGSLQLFDTLLAGDNSIAASTLNAGASGNVPPIIKSISATGGGGNAVAFTYALRGDYAGYDVIAQITSGGAGNTFTIVLDNPAPRALATIAIPGKRYQGGLDYGCTPISATVTQCDAVFIATGSYPGSVNRTGYLCADMLNDTTNRDGPLSQPSIGGGCMPELDLPPFTALSSLNLTLNIIAASSGVIVLRFGRPTLRQLN